MPRQKVGKPGRYDYRVIVLRIERMRIECGLMAKQIAADVGLSEAAWSKKMSMNQSSFSLDELGRVAEAFAKASGKPLTGWPFVDPDVSRRFDGQ